jgi:hypothetical protein
VLAVAVLAAVPLPSRWEAAQAAVKLVALGSAVWLAIWLEERLYARFIGRAAALPTRR